MLTTLRRHRRKLLIIVCLALPLLCGYYGYGLSINIFPAQRLASARSAWQAQNIDSYLMTINVSRYHVFFGIYQVKVMNGEITEAGYRKTIYPPGAPVFEIENLDEFYFEEFDTLPQHLTDYTMDNLFDVIIAALDRESPILVTACNQGSYSVTFDPQLGYISDFSASEYSTYYPDGRQPFFCGTLHAIGEGFTITAFEVLHDDVTR